MTRLSPETAASEMTRCEAEWAQAETQPYLAPRERCPDVSGDWRAIKRGFIAGVIVAAVMIAIKFYPVPEPAPLPSPAAHTSDGVEGANAVANPVAQTDGRRG